jgi:hypothetical protein
MSTIERRVGGKKGERFDGYANVKERVVENTLCYFNLFVKILSAVIICFHLGC